MVSNEKDVSTKH